MSKNFIITLNRECGAGATNIAKLLSKELDIPYYDKDMFRMVSDKSGVLEEFFHVNDERPGNNLLYKLIKELKPASQKPSLGKDIVSPDNLFRFQSELIKELAENESCIIIGRCADYVLDGTEGLIRVFLYADIKVREERVRERNLYADKDVLKNIHRIDRERRDYNRYYAGRDWEKPENYDLLINTTQIGVDGAVQLIKDYLKMRGLL